ncbi:MAG: glycerol-3-phosphate dehydrogenase [Proteobacteria bacterium]|nr:glycerol-3-phosphate dehydrogenase [Pseudomonadota bacterium]
MASERPYDLAIIGGGINGAGIACDAAGRGLSVVLIEAGDLAGATSSASSKLIHGGLRYLEHWEFRLVREALAEREVLLAKAPHLIRPMRFVLPHVAALRSRWLIRLGLFLYDHLSTRTTIGGSRALDFAKDKSGIPLRDKFSHGFAYWDCWVDDSRLVILNAMSAANNGADILTQTRFDRAQVEDGLWRLDIKPKQAGASRQVTARAIVNAAGPWADKVLKACDTGTPSTGDNTRLRLIKGSHIVVPRIEGADDAYILQQDDGRVVFVIPYEENYSMIGTTDVPIEGEPEKAAASADEIHYMLAAVNRYITTEIKEDDIVWKFSGVRPLYDDDAESASKVTRDYHLVLQNGDGAPPILSIFGGKITTYRCLAEEALEKLSPFFPNMGRPWTRKGFLPGGNLPGGAMEAFLDDLFRRYPKLEQGLITQLAQRHGSIATDILGDAGAMDDLGQRIGDGLYEREIDYFKRQEWARTAEDILWRRTKAGLHLAPADREGAAAMIEALL